jgi:hypothetical protein
MTKPCVGVEEAAAGYQPTAFPLNAGFHARITFLSAGEERIRDSVLY